MDHASVGSPWMWGAFLLFVVAMLALDLGVFHRKSHTVSTREALGWSAVWITLATVFGGVVWWAFGATSGMDFFAGYLIEKSLSVDNIFVFVVIFQAMRIPAAQQHRVLFWGILSALAMRAGMIFAGAALLERFHFLFYVFGLFLVGTGVKLFIQREHDEDPTGGWAMRQIRKFVPSTDTLDGEHFTTRLPSGRLVATPLLIALLLIEVTDVIFAVDSIPAIFAVTTDPFLVFTSNIFAILGLRSLYFLLAGMVDRFRYLKVGLAAVLIFVGAKMTLLDVVKIPSPVSLAAIAAILGLSVAASLWVSRDEPGAL